MSMSATVTYSWTREGESIGHTMPVLTVEYRDSVSPVMAGGDYSVCVYGHRWLQYCD